MRERTAADDNVQGAYNRALLALIIEPMRICAKDHGFAITVHGSLNRDIDLVAIPWAENADTDVEQLVASLCSTIRSVVGRCNRQSGRTPKPFGRVAYTLLAWCGENSANIDLSVILPFIPKEQNFDADK